MLRTGYSTKSSRLVALVTRMERISLSLSHPLPLSHPLSRSLSFGWTTTPIGGFSGKSRKFDPESVPKKLAARHTEDRINHSRQEKILFLPSRDHQKLDLDAMCLDLESSRLPNQETSGRGNVASIHQHPPTHRPTHFPRDRDTKKKSKSTARPGFPAASISSFHSTHPPPLPVPISPQPPLYIHSLHPQNTTQEIPNSSSSSASSAAQPRNLAKNKISGRNRKDGEFVLGPDFCDKKNGLDWTADTAQQA